MVTAIAGNPLISGVPTVSAFVSVSAFAGNPETPTTTPGTVTAMISGG